MIALVLLALAAAPSAPPAPFSSEVIPAAPGHPRVVLAPRPGPRAAVVVRFEVGSVDDATGEGPAPGLTHLTQLAMLRANAGLDHAALVRDLFEADGELTVRTGLESCEFRLSAAAGDLDRLAARVLPALLAPALQGGRSFEGARDEALHHRRESRGGQLVAELAHLSVPDAAYGSPPHGDRATLEALSPAQVQRHASRWFTPGNATVAFAGAFDVRAARALAARFAGGGRTARRVPDVRTPFSLQAPSGKEAYLVAFRWGSRDRPPPAAWLLAAVAEERIHERLRAKGMGYAEAVEVLDEPWLSGLVVIVPGNEEAAAPVGPEIEGILAELRSGVLAPDEVERNRGWLQAELARVDASPLDLATALVRRSGLEAAWAAAVQAVDGPALSRAATELLREQDAIRIYLNPQATRSGPLPDWTRATGGRP